MYVYLTHHASFLKLLVKAASTTAKIGDKKDALGNVISCILHTSLLIQLVNSHSQYDCGDYASFNAKGKDT